MFNPQSFENSRPDGIAVLEIPGDPPSFVPLLRTEVRGQVAGPFATMRLTQVFGYTRAQCERTLEAMYRFPAPGDAAVVGVRVQFGEVTIEAALADRATAEAGYEAAIAEGRQAALLRRETPDVFTLLVAGLVPDQQIQIETRYVALARGEEAGWALRIPLTTAPRYLRDDEMVGRQAQGQPLWSLRDPGHLAILDIQVCGATDVASATHRLRCTPEGDGVRAQFADGHVVPDRDLVLAWRPRREAARPSLQAWSCADTAGHLYFLAAVAPPAATERALPREVILLVDRSGSMEGAKWEAADWAVGHFLSGLTAADRFTIGLFHSSTVWLSDTPIAATPEALARASAFLASHRDSGGTELGVALEQALAIKRQPDIESRHVLVITDAEVGDSGRILRLADAEWGRPDRRRISVLCIDAAPNALLATELAEQGGGVARFLSSAPEDGDIATALSEVLADWGQPVEAGLRLAIDRPGLLAAGRRLCTLSGGKAAVDLGDLPAGRALWVCGRADLAGAGPARLRLLAGDGTELAAAVAAESALDSLKALFGARRVRGLEELVQAGYGPAELAERIERLGYQAAEALGTAAQAVYAENAQDRAARALRPLLVREALAYGLASAETAFVAIRTERGQRAEGTVLVANAAPAGRRQFHTGGVVMLAPASHRFAVYGPSIDNLFAASMRTTLSPLHRGLSMPKGDLPPALAAPTAAAAPLGTGSRLVVYAGVPRPAGEETLFESGGPGRGRLPYGILLTGLRLLFPSGAPSAASIPASLRLLLYVGDAAAPRARMAIADLLRQGGVRPLHVARETDQEVWLVLVDPDGAWAAGGPAISLELEWAPL